MTAKTTHINARCDEKRKRRYMEMAESFGYANFSEFLIAVLDAMSDRYRDEGWESHLVHVSGDRILAADAHEMNGIELAVSAFPVVAPATFWHHVRTHGVNGDDDSGSPGSL